MNTNPVIEMMGRRLRLAVIGAGPGSFIGSIHHTAARIDDRYKLVAGALTSDPERSRAAGRPEGFHEAFATIYSDAAEAIAARRSGTTVDPLAQRFPNAEDGVLGVRFVDAAMASSVPDGAWTNV